MGMANFRTRSGLLATLVGYNEGQRPGLIYSALTGQKTSVLTVDKCTTNVQNRVKSSRCFSFLCVLCESLCVPCGKILTAKFAKNHAKDAMDTSAILDLTCLVTAMPRWVNTIGLRYVLCKSSLRCTPFRLGCVKVFRESVASPLLTLGLCPDGSRIRQGYKPGKHCVRFKIAHFDIKIPGKV